MQVEAHRAFVGALWQTGQASHDVVLDGKGDTCVSTLCPGPTAPEEGVAGTHFFQLALFEEPGLTECRIFDEYVPPEGDGKTSLLSTEGLTEKKDLLSKKAKSMRAMRRISKHQPTFSTAAFPNEADAIYKEANLLLPRYFDNESRLLELLTEKAFVEMTDGLRLRTLHWQFKGSLEPPRVVSMRTEEAIGKDNIFAQVTVRFLTQQVLAIYDRFGRLLFGHPTSPVDVLEYIVFENHITDAFGQWRIHGKIVPPWARVMATPNKTHRLLPGADKTPADSESQLSSTADSTHA
ncbi:39S ribosomal protein L45, mitochondrial [Sparganum proliferum]